jgi:RNA polymerase sigma factor (sigma-70 family)
MKDYSVTNNANRILEARDQENGSDFELWKSFQEGDDCAFVTIYKKFVNILFNVGIQYSPDEDLVRDCLQDFFISIRQKRSSLANVRDIKSYLVKSFVRRIIEYLKKSKKFVRIDSDNVFIIEVATEKLKDSVLDEEQLKMLDNAIKSLDKKEREAIYYYYYQKLSYCQIAEIYNYEHVSSARRLIYKCLEKLKKKYQLMILIMLTCVCSPN